MTTKNRVSIEYPRPVELALILAVMHSWEMSTIGHPLSDLSNLFAPFTLNSEMLSISSRKNAAFSASSLATGLPTRPQCIDWYAGIAGWDPRADLGWGDAFGVFRNSVIMQGIAARYAMRQASSAKAKEYAVEMVPFGNFAWVLVEALMRKRENEMKAKL